MVNPDEIHGFLQKISRGQRYGYDQGGHTAGPSTPRSFIDSQTPGSSEYSCSRASQSREIASDASTVNYTMAPSIFSYQSGKSRSSAGNTSAPSVHPGQQTFDQFVIAGPGPNQARGDLWCEFSELFGCNATFQLNDTEGWIQHHVGHLNGKCPLQSTCWFCDDIQFRTDAEPYATFWDRMEHIRSHILYDDRLTSNHVRPDFHMLKHLYNTNLIGFDLYHHARNYDELPQSLRCPGSSTSSPMPAYQHFESRDQVQVYPISKEEKREARKYKGKSSGRNKH